MALKIQSQGKTDIGSVRSTNQDNILVEDDIGLYIVADGMGGHAGGELASQLCIEKVREKVSEFMSNLDKKPSTTEILRMLERAINFASSKIYEYSLENPNLRGMGTTCTLFLVIDDNIYCGHVGDSRLYLLRSEFIYQLSFDHSLVNEQLKAGVISADEAKNHQLRNVITRSVGYQEEEDVDTFFIKVTEGDIIACCSDGLHGKVEDTEIFKVLHNNYDDGVSKLIDLANENGGEDNISLVTVKFS